jgi:phospholipid/cholesterol/gamma-HCH transport system substrate-binding protein
MERTRKLIVGIFVGGCLVLFGVGMFLIGNSNQLFTKSFNVFADFSKITGIQNGGKVRVAGMDAGTVTRVEVPSRPQAKFRVHFRVMEKLHPIVRQDSIVTIQTDGLLGSKYLQIEAGSADAPLARNDSLIQSKEPFDWGDLMSEMNGVVKQVNEIVAGVKDQLISTLSQIEDTAKTANLLIEGATPDVKGILASADKIGANLGEIIDGIQAGQGTVGALFKDKELYSSVKGSVDNTGKAVENLRDTTASAKKIINTVQESDIVPEVERTVKNLQQITLQVKDAVDKFQSASGEGGVGENLQRVLVDAHEMMSNLSDDTEALKHNFLFRGFFNKRGFFDLAALTAPEYKSPNFAKAFKRHRVWLESVNLFDRDAKGVEVLSVEGKARLDEAMTDILTFPRNGPLMVEGFAGEGTASQQYLQGRRRAVRVQLYIIDRFDLSPAYVGVISMGAEPLDKGSPVGFKGGFKEGVGIVSFYK